MALTKGNTMTDQPSLFDEPLAIALLEEAIERVGLNADQLWALEAFKIVEMLSIQRHDFTTDDVWEWMNQMHPELTTHEPRAMGAVMRKASSDRLCVPTERYSKSLRPECHRRPIRVWQGI
jgi:hypothetical protein